MKKKPINKPQLALSKDKKVFGVVGGMAEHLGIDISLARIVVLIFIIMTGIIPGIIIYFIFSAMVMPDSKNRKL